MKKMEKIIIILILTTLFSGCGPKNISPDNVSEVNKKLFNKQYTLESFPYYFDEEGKNISDLYNKSLKADEKEFISVKRKNKSEDDYNYGIYEQTLDNSMYLYYGDTKNKKPNGYGIVYKYDSNKKYLYMLSIGKFKNGYLDGYAIDFENSFARSVGSYEGYFKKGVRSGKYIYYAFRNMSTSRLTRKESSIHTIGEYNFQDISFCVGDVVSIIGDFTNDMTGVGAKYNSNGTTMYSGEWKKASYNGTGTLYYDDATIQYKGKFKNGEYEGKGVLYNQDGSVQYKGKFKNGDIK